VATEFTLDLKKVTSGEWITYLHSLLYKCGVQEITDPPSDTVDNNSWNFMFFQSDHGIEEYTTEGDDEYAVVGPKTWAALEDQNNWVDRAAESSIFIDFVSIEVTGTGVQFTAKNASESTAKAHQHTDYLGHDIEEHDREHRGWRQLELEQDVPPGGEYTVYVEWNFDQSWWQEEGGGSHVVWLKLNGGFEGDEGKGSGMEVRQNLSFVDGVPTLAY